MEDAKIIEHMMHVIPNLEKDKIMQVILRRVFFVSTL